MALPVARLLPEEGYSSVMHTNSLTRRKTPSTTWRYQRGRLRLFKLICLPKPHHVSFKTPSLFHTINGISKLKNLGMPSPTANFNSLILACCKHLVVDKPPAYTLCAFVVTLPCYLALASRDRPLFRTEHELNFPYISPVATTAKLSPELYKIPC